MSDLPKDVWSHCNACGRTRHRIAASHKSHIQDEDRTEFVYNVWNYESEILECAGCGAHSFKAFRQFEDYGCEPETVCYPPKAYRRKPGWMTKFGHSDGLHELRLLLEEVYSALAVGTNRLALMGIRCAIDVVIQRTVGDVQSFKDGIEALKAQNHLSANEATLLGDIVNAGNAAAHRNFCPDEGDLMVAMDTLEHLLQKLYVLPSAVASLKTRTPQRPPRQNRTSGQTNG